jgi:hypothetical protein
LKRKIQNTGDRKQNEPPKTQHEGTKTRKHEKVPKVIDEKGEDSTQNTEGKGKTNHENPKARRQSSTKRI